MRFQIARSCGVALLRSSRARSVCLFGMRLRSFLVISRRRASRAPTPNPSLAGRGVFLLRRVGEQCGERPAFVAVAGAVDRVVEIPARADADEEEAAGIGSAGIAPARGD